MGGKDLPDSKKAEIVQFLIQNLKDGKPTRGKINEAVATFNCSRRTLSRIWKAANQQRLNGEVICVTNKRFGVTKHPKHEVNQEQIAQVHYQKRGTIRALADQINVSKSVVGRWAKSNMIKAHTNAIKPDLTALNKLVRLCFSLQAIEYDNALDIFKFKPMENVIHIDEKWFYLTKDTHRYYMTEGEQEPYRTCKSKKFIPKVMFMCAVCRPLFGEEGSVVFYGKIEIWPFTEEVPAKRNSKKRVAGTIETKPISSITKEVIKDCLITKIVPAIKAKWPACLSKTIYIQQDNAKPHINNSDQDFQAIANSDGFQISLVQQPANSPDMNVNDLGFFRAIQSLQQQNACKDACELVSAVLSSFNNLEPMTLNKVFLSLQCCLQEIMKVKGCNNYKIPHMQKNALLLHHELPTNLELPKQLIKECLDFLIQAGHTRGIEGLITDLGSEG